MDTVVQIAPVLLTLLAGVIVLPIVAWTAGALYYDVGRGTGYGVSLVAFWIVVVVAGFLFWQPTWQPLLTLVCLFGLFLCWWFTQRPSHQRHWQPLMARLAHANVDGNTVTIENVRNAEYTTRGEATPRYETRSFRLSQLRSADAVFCFWGSSWMCHPMFIFDFGDDGRICMSVEVRYRIGQRYSFLRSLYRQQELIYLVCDERDAILRRTKYASDQDVYLYRLLMPADDVREAFHEYIQSIDRLLARPRWYHGLTSNCTTSVYAQRRRRAPWDWRLLINGGLDRLFYERERFDQSLPFEMLKAASRVNDVANAAPVDGFGDYLRRQLPGYRFDGDPSAVDSRTM